MGITGITGGYMLGKGVAATRFPPDMRPAVAVGTAHPSYESIGISRLGSEHA
jgi:hypothetical protein